MEDSADEGLPPPPPPPPMEGQRVHGVQNEIPQGFQKAIVHGRTKTPDRQRKPTYKPPSDQHLPTARLKLLCFDKTTGLPLANVQVQVKNLPGTEHDRNKSVSNAFGSRSYSRKDGFVSVKVLAGYPYLVAATAPGFHDFGHMGEQLLLTPKDTEVVQGEVGLVPIRIAVVVTLRELRPVHHAESMERDVTGQVNPLVALPRIDQRLGIAPQKVSFYSSEGVKMDFVATTVECHDVLVGWPAALGEMAETAECTLGIYSTDTEGHCFFYGPKINDKRGTRRNRDLLTIDVGRWEYARKYHLRANQESPVAMVFDDFSKHVRYPAHVARYPPRANAGTILARSRSPSPPRTRPSTASAGRSKEQLLSSFLASAAEVAATASSGGSVADPNDPNDHAPAGDAGDVGSPRRSVRGRPGSAGRSRPGSARGGQSRTRQSAAAAAAGEEGGDTLADLEAELRVYPDNNIHNYLDPGAYKLQMKDPSRLLIFYTYSGDGEAAEINRAQNAVVPFTMMPSEEGFIHPRDGSVLRPTQFPVQLYCRARPWFHIAVYDVETLEEVGSRYGLSFTIERISIVRSAQPGGGEGAEEERTYGTGATTRRKLTSAENPELTAYLDKQRERGKLAHLWAKAEVAEAEATGRPLTFAPVIPDDPADPNIYPYRVEEVEVVSDLIYSGELGQSKEKMWMTPGERYRVTVHMRTPFLDYKAVQVRSANWELEPFVFYAQRKVVLIIGVREKWNQEPMPNTKVIVEILEPPQAPRPPVVKPEWCETPESYANRVLDQLIDYVVQNNRENLAIQRADTMAEEAAAAAAAKAAATPKPAPGSDQAPGTPSERGPGSDRAPGSDLAAPASAPPGSAPASERGSEHAPSTPKVAGSDAGVQVGPSASEAGDGAVVAAPQAATSKAVKGMGNILVGYTDVEGLVSFEVPPECKVSVRVVNTDDFEDADVTRDQLLTSEPEQFVGFQLERITRTAVVVVDNATGEGVAGYKLRAFDITEHVPEIPKDGVRKIRTLLDPELLDKIDVSGLEPFATEWTGGDGATLTPFFRRAGRVIKVEVMEPPPSHMMPARVMARGNCLYVATYDKHSLVFKAPPRPRVRIMCADTCTFEEVYGVRFRVMARPLPAPPPGTPSLAGSRRSAQGSHAPSRAGSVRDSAVGDDAAMDEPIAPPSEAAAPSVAVRDVSAIGVLQGQQAATLEQIQKLEAGWEALAQDYEAEQSEALGAQKRHLELLVQQLKTALKRQQQQLDLLLAADNTMMAATVDATPPPDLESMLPERQPVYWDGQERPLEEEGSYASGASGGNKRNADLLVQLDADQQKRLQMLRSGLKFPASESAARSMGGGRNEEEEAALKLRAEEQGVMAMFSPSAEEEELWGRVLWDSVTGLEENEGMIMHEDAEIAVQIFPCWPYDTRSQMLKGRVVGHIAPPDFLFYLPRDGEAFKYWLDRDEALPDFWDETGAVRLPYHPLARLQPHAPPHRLISKPHGEMKLLRAPDFDLAALPPPGARPRKEAAASVEARPGTLAHSKHESERFNVGTFHPHIVYTDVMPEYKDAAVGVASLWTDLPNGTARLRPTARAAWGETQTQTPAAAAVADAGTGTEEELEAAARKLSRTVSAIQFDPNDTTEGTNDLAWQQLRLSDASYLPLERTRLLQFLTRWGSFPHIQGGHCKACSGADRPPDTNPLLLSSTASLTPRAASDTSRGGHAEEAGQVKLYGELKPGSLYKSRLLPAMDLTAGWVLESRAAARTELPPHMRRHVTDRFARTHVIVANSEAVYCKSPFFTWWLPNGGGVHVTMSDGLYRELIPLLDAVALSVEYMEQHLEKVRTLNEGRGKHGRFLLGHEIVDSFCGGVFIVDASTAQPYSGIGFMLQQLCKTFDFWATNTPEGAATPRFDVLLCSRDVVEVWRPALGFVTEGLLPRLTAWYEDVKLQMPTQPGFDLVKALRAAGAVAKSEVPIFLLCGGLLTTPLNTPSEMSKVLYDMQLACLNTKAPMQAVNAIELYPMPQARPDGGNGSQAPAADAEEGEGGGEGSAGNLTPRTEGSDASATPVSMEEATALGSDIFALLIDSLNTERVRLLEVFREVDKDGDRALDWQQLYRLVLRLVPHATPAHIRYIQLLLDRTGDNRVRYKDLAAAVRACARGGITVSLRDRLEVRLVLHKMAILMLQSKTTPNELYAKYDEDKDGFWSEKEQWNMLKDLFPSLRPAEHQLLFDSFQDVDKNRDGRISRDEFARAFSSGGVPGMPGSGTLGHPDQLKKMIEAGTLDDFTLMAMMATEENKQLVKIRAAGFPLTATLAKIAGATRGSHRRLDLGRARAFADAIDLVPLEAVAAALSANLQQLLEFEKAYGRQLTVEHLDRPRGTARGVSSLTADPPSPAAITRSPGPRARPASAGRPSRPASAFASPPASVTAGSRTPGAAALASQPPPLSALTSRASLSQLPTPRDHSPPGSVRSGRSGRSARSLARLMEPTASHSAYVAATSRPASVLSGSRPSSASRQRPTPASPMAAWAAAASASDDPHLRRLAEHEAGRGAPLRPQASGGSGGAADAGFGGEGSGGFAIPPLSREHSMPPIARESSSTLPWATGGSAGGGGAASGAGGLARELSIQRSSLLSGLGADGDEARQEYRPPSSRSMRRPSNSYGSRTGSPRASGEGLGGLGLGGGGGGGEGGSNSRPSSAPARRPSFTGSVAGSVSGGAGGGSPLAFQALPRPPSARRQLPMGHASFGLDAADGLDGGASTASGLPFLSPDPNAAPSAAGSRPGSASRRSFGPGGFGRLDSQASRGSGN